MERQWSGVLVLVCLVLTPVLARLAASDALWAEERTVTLTVIARDADGQRLAGVHVQLLQDRAGTVTPVMHGHGQTDARGQLIVRELAPGYTYLVQFHGALPDGRPIQRIDDQNGGRRADGGGQVAGFGVKLDRDATQVFAFGGTREADPGAPALPMFDLAGSDAAPRPVSPVTGQEIPASQASALAARPAGGAAARPAMTDPAVRRSLRLWRWFWVALVVLGIALGLGRVVALTRARRKTRTA